MKNLWIIEYDSGTDSSTGETIGAGQSCYRTVAAPDKAAAEAKLAPHGEELVAGPLDTDNPDHSETLKAFGC